MKSIYNLFTNEYLDERIADIAMEEVVARARARIAEAAETGSLKDISDAITALEQPNELRHLFNVILGKIIPGARIVYFASTSQACRSLEGCLEISNKFEEKYIDTFDKDDKLAAMLLRTLSDRIKNRKS